MLSHKKKRQASKPGELEVSKHGKYRRRLSQGFRVVLFNFIYTFCVVWKSLLSLTHSMCFMAQPRIRIWRKKRKKKSWTQETAQKFYSIMREKLCRSNDGAGTHRWTRTFGSVGWRKRDSRLSRSWNQCAPNSLGDRSFFVCQLRVVVFFFALFSRWTRFFMLHRARGEWRDLNSHARWRQIDFFSCK